MTHQGTKPLQTERLFLRQFTIEDAQAMYDNWAKDERVARYLAWLPHSSVEITKKLLQDWWSSYADPGYYNWVIEYEGVPIGNISTVHIGERSQWVELGYCMGYAYWGKGLMTEAVKAVIDYFFEEVGVHRIRISHATDNPASGKVAQKCGLSYEGTQREAFRSLKGEYWDIANYAILRSQWEAKHNHRDCLTAKLRQSPFRQIPIYRSVQRTQCRGRFICSINRNLIRRRS